MKKLLPFLLLAALLIPVALFAMQDTSPLRIEITGVNATELPTASITANVYDNLGQPVRGLTVDNFALTGSLAEFGQIVDVQNITDDNLPFATVLVIDISSSMDGVNPATSPIQRAKNAASAFVENIRDNDPVALVTFGSSVNIVQPYTTDKAAVLAAINGIVHGGETALYQAGYDAVRLAAESPLSRRVVILLSDGAEYGGNSRVGRDAAALEALTRGVPVYTIGLGFGTDRTYLENLSRGTNARFYESPTPDELEGIYQELAALLRSQYVITLNADVPLDGTEYDFGIQVTTDAGTAEATATLRAPIPVPVVRLPDLPTTPVVRPVTITAQVLADDPITGVSFAFGDTDPVTLTEAPYTFSIDPALLQPGDYPLTVVATDEDEEVGLVSGTITIGVLPPTFTLDPNPSTLGEIADPVTVSITTGGQTPVTGISIAYDGGESIALTEPYTFTIDPVQFTPGDHLVMVMAINEGGQSAISPVAFNIAAIPPTVTIRGLEDGQSIDEPVTFTVSVIGQGALTAISASVADTIVTPDSAGLITLDPQFLVPGANEITVSATTDNGMTGSSSVTVLVAALEPQILVSGIEPDETIDADTNISVNFFSQTPITSASASVDGNEIAELEGDPAVFTLAVLGFAPGEHTLTIEAENQSGQTGSIEIPFSISPALAATATAVAQAQATATQTVIDATASAEVASIAATATAQAVEAAATATAQFSIQATATAAIQNSTGTAQAQVAATQTANVAVAATASAAVESTQSAQSANATGTSEAAGIAAQATQTAEQSSLAAGATATTNAQLTAEANRQATQDALSTETNALQLTANANDQATAGAQATQDALTADANAQATTDAQSTATNAAESTQTALTADANAQATAAAQATQDGLSTATDAAQLTQAALTAEADSANATATQIAELTRAVDATATNAQQLADLQSTVQVSTRSALATSNAEARLNAQATQDSRGTRAARTATAAAENAALTATATAEAATAAAQAAAIADETATAIAEAIASQTAQAALDAAASATADAGATATIQQLAIEATATGAANATERANLLATEDGATMVALTDTVSTAAAVTRAAVLAVTDAARTAVAEETVSAQQTAVGPTATLADAVAQAATATGDLATPTQPGTLTPLTTDAPPSGSDSTPIILVVIAVIVVLLLLFFALRRGNNTQRR